MKDKNNPFDYRSLTGNNYKLKGKLKKAVISILIVTIIIVFGQGGIKQHTVNVIFYNTYDNEIEQPSLTLIHGENTTSDFFLFNNSPTTIKVTFDIEDCNIDNPVHIIGKEKKVFISLNVKDVRGTGKYKVQYEVEAQ